MPPKPKPETKSNQEKFNKFKARFAIDTARNSKAKSNLKKKEENDKKDSKKSAAKRRLEKTK